MAVYLAGPLRRPPAPPGEENEWKSEDGERSGGSPVAVGRTTGDWGDGTEGRAASLLHAAFGLHPLSSRHPLPATCGTALAVA